MPVSSEQLDFLKESIETRIKSINSSRLYYRRKSFYAFISTAVLAAITSILLGLNVDEQWADTIRITSLSITTVITLINTYNAFFNHKEMWIANNEALNKFYALKFNINFVEKGDTILQETVDKFKDTYQATLDELNQSWFKTRTETQQ